MHIPQIDFDYSLQWFIVFKKLPIWFILQAATSKKLSWISVQSNGEKNKTLGHQSEEESIKKMILFVEKALKIGVPLFCVIFIGAFFAVGFCM